MTIRSQIIEAIVTSGPLTARQIAERVRTKTLASLRVAIAHLVAQGDLVRSDAKWRSTYRLPGVDA